MSTPANSLYLAACRRAVEESKARLTLGDVWDLAPHASQSMPPGNGLGVVRSPLREDRTPSFSIFAAGKAFADKARADVKGGVWEFVALCCPNMPSREIARTMVERAGLAWPDSSAFKGDVSENDSAKAKRLREERLARKRAEEAQMDQAERQRRAERDGMGRHALAMSEWPDCVAARWAEGAAYRDGDPVMAAKLCTKRGWPTGWADMLGELDVLAFPYEPWCEPGGRGAKRMIAFKVQAPRVARGEAELVTVGYHQKFFNVAADRSGWRFLPTSKRPERPEASWSSYERAVIAAADYRGAEEGKAMVPPLPFVAGCLARPRLVIILEGQWDALTMMGAMGGLSMDVEGPADIAYFGIRGVNGTQAFVDYWGGWIRDVRPLVWLLPDNDGAKTGGQWFPPARAAERKQGVVYLSERLGFMGARSVVVTPLRTDAGTGGKDFNDYFKAAQPDVAAMWRWMGTLKLV